ncbi:aspartyl/asparaginyl beta-hydroxylase domain-containing protein [Neptunicella sp.]|uniref:aspartyl/asparaginyl beta-hydroxylase domain-containing protein n=1 Tax=Neptunicella sp. TaxID=2125986 RepID=UPI003F690095
MYFEGRYRKIGQADCSALAEYIAAMPDSVWDENTDRQNVYDVHASTQMIPLIFDADFRHRFPTVHKQLAEFSQWLEPAMQSIIDYYRSLKEQHQGYQKLRFNQAYFVRIILVRLAAGTEIKSHTDHGYSLSRAHRIHWPVITNEAVSFCIDDENKTLPAGELWEVNNRCAHSVKNASQFARYHVIFDFVIPHEAINDPQLGRLQA